MWPQLKTWIEKHEPILYISILLVILRIPSLFEPYWYGDEGIYLTIGQALRHGVELYRGIHDNKPPLLYLLAALANGQLFWFKFLALIANLITVIIFSKLVKRWHPKYIFSLIALAPLKWLAQPGVYQQPKIATRKSRKVKAKLTDGH